MQPAEVTILSECERVGQVVSTLVVGDMSEHAREALPGATTMISARALLERDVNESFAFDLAVIVGHDECSAIQRRALGHALAEMVHRVVISVQPLGDEIPVPLVELKRGLLLDAPELGYRVYGKRVQQ